MAWINGRWVEDRPGFGGMLGSLGRRPEEELIYGGTFDAPSPSLIQGPPIPPRRPQPIYDRGPQMQPSPYQPTQWAGPNAIYPNWDDPAGPFANDVAMLSVQGPPPPSQNVGWDTGAISNVPSVPPQMYPLTPTPPRMPAPPQQPIYDRGPQMQPPVPPQMRPPMNIPGRMPAGIRPDPVGVNLGSQLRPPMPPPPPNIGDVWESAPPEIIRPPIPPSITIADPPRRPEPPKKKAKKVKRTRRPSRGPTPPPATRPGRTQEGKGPKGPRTITGIARSHRGRGDR